MDGRHGDRGRGGGGVTALLWGDVEDVVVVVGSSPPPEVGIGCAVATLVKDGDAGVVDEEDVSVIGGGGVGGNGGPGHPSPRPSSREV